MGFLEMVFFREQTLGSSVNMTEFLISGLFKIMKFVLQSILTEKTGLFVDRFLITAIRISVAVFWLDSFIIIYLTM